MSEMADKLRNLGDFAGRMAGNYDRRSAANQELAMSKLVDAIRAVPGLVAEIGKLPELHPQLKNVTHVTLDGFTSEEDALRLREAIMNMGTGGVVGKRRRGTYHHAPCKMKFTSEPIPTLPTFDIAEGYEQLVDVFQAAHNQAAYGKGKERHANNLPFHKQRMQQISTKHDSPYGMAYQVDKKVTEGLTFTDAERREHELLGAMVYLGGMIVWLRNREEKPE